MDPENNVTQSYSCPMHADIRQPGGGKCPKCGMNLVPEGARFGMLRHVIANPLMLAIMAAVMIAVMWMAFM
jgi:hypothetical protein